MPLLSHLWSEKNKKALLYIIYTHTHTTHNDIYIYDMGKYNPYITKDSKYHTHSSNKMNGDD